MRSPEYSKGEVTIYKARGGPVLDVRLEQETVWLTLNEIAKLFDTDKSGVSRHIGNIYKAGELTQRATVAKIATVQREGSRTIGRQLKYYNLDLIISVGYRINSTRATQFRIWGTKILKQHLVKGYTVNEKRLLQAKKQFTELQEAIAFLKEKAKHELLTGQGREILNLLAGYSSTLTLLGQYDKEKLALVRKAKSKFVLEYPAVKKVIDEVRSGLMAKNEASDLFGQENGDKLKAILGNIYQTFGGRQLYASLEEKAAHLLYFIIKDHPFVDGNKRLGSFLFVYFLSKNNYLYKESGEKKISNNALTTLALLTAVSDPKEKDKLVKLVSNLIK